MAGNVLKRYPPALFEEGRYMKMTKKKLIAQRKWRTEHPGYDKVANHKWYTAHKEIAAARCAKWRTEYPERHAAKNLKWYNSHKKIVADRRAKQLVHDQELFAGCKKPSKCDICHKHGKICFDHCHKSLKFRGWSCFNCNLVLGHVKDSASLCLKLAAYLERPLLYHIVYTKRLRKFDALLLGARPSKCSICKQPGKIVRDHCHYKNLIRGWLCSHCNTAIGHAHNSPKLLRKLAEYLKAAKKKGAKLWI